MNAVEELTKIVRAGNVTDDPQTLTAYSRDNSFVPPVSPACMATIYG